MKKKFDFIIGNNYNTDSQLVLRFYTKSSHVHVFNKDDSLKSWDKVYKVYFSYAVLSQDFGWSNRVDTEVMYKEESDENSCLIHLSNLLGEIVSGEEKELEYKLYPVSDGTRWELNYHPKSSILDKKSHWEFRLFNTWNHKGYYFILTEDRLLELKEVIDDFLDYMLKHSEVI